MLADEGLVRIGRVIKPHGIRGELVVAAEGNTLAELAAGARVEVAGSSYIVAGLRPHQGRLLLTLDGCADRTAAETLRGASVEVAVEELPGLVEDEWYADDLIGWTLFDGDGAGLGVVTAVLPGPVHDYLQIGTDEPRLIPMVSEWLVGIDSPHRGISMNLPAGLLEPEGE